MKEKLRAGEAILKRTNLPTDPAKGSLVRQAAHQDLRALRGSEPDAQDVPRRREKMLSQ